MVAEDEPWRNVNEVAMRNAAALMLLRLLKTEVYCPVTGSGPAGKVASGT